MTDIWFEDELVPDMQLLNEMLEGSMGDTQDELEQIEKLRRTISVHTPYWRVLDDAIVRDMAVADQNKTYMLMRLWCDFDTESASQKKPFGFESAKIGFSLWSDEQCFRSVPAQELVVHPKVFALQPTNINSGKPTPMKLQLGPTITLASGMGFSAGGVELNINVGEVAPVVHGFAGEDERNPYWKLNHHREAPLYGSRHFWLVLELHPSLKQFYIECNYEAALRIKGNVLLRMIRPTVSYKTYGHIENQPYYTISL